MRKRVLLTGFILCTIFAVCGYAAAQTDILYLKGRTIPPGNTDQTVRVVDEKFDSISVKVMMGTVDGGMSTVPAADVIRIEHFDAPMELKQGIAALEGRNYQQSLDALNKVKDKPRPWVDIYVLFYKAEALKGLGMTDKEKNNEAATLYKELLSKHPNTIFKVKAMIGDAQASLQMDKLDEAREKLRKIKSQMPSTKWETMADLSLANIEEKDGKYDKAASKYRQIATLSSDPDLKIQGTLGEIRCLVHDKRYDDALRKTKQLMEKTEDKRIIGSAWSVMGDCYYARAGGDKKKIKDALLAYLRVVVVYFYEPEITAKSAYMAGECFGLLEDAKRAKEQYGRAAETAGGGEWQRKAARKIQG